MAPGGSTTTAGRAIPSIELWLVMIDPPSWSRAPARDSPRRRPRCGPAAPPGQARRDVARPEPQRIRTPLAPRPAARRGPVAYPHRRPGLGDQLLNGHQHDRRGSPSAAQEGRRAVLAPERTLGGNPAGSSPRSVLAADRKVARHSALRKCDGGNESPRHLRSLGSGIDSTAATTAGSLRLANDTSGTKVNGRSKFRCHIVTPSLPKSSNFLYRFRTVFCSTKSRSRSVRNQNGISQ